MSAICPYCPITHPETEIVFEREPHLHVIPRFTEEPLAGKAGIRTLLKSKANQW